jgi:hypothetical protein
MRWSVGFACFYLTITTKTTTKTEREIEISDFSHWLMFFSAFAICIQSRMVVWSLVSDDVAVAYDDDDDYDDEDDEVLIAIET